MFAGHAAVALLGKRFRKEVAFWALLPATYGPDLVQFAAEFAGASDRQGDLLSHSIPAVLAVACAGALLYYIGGARDALSAALLAGMSLSHITLDYITGRKPLWPGGPWIGLNLYERPHLDFVLEAGILIVCWLAYRRALGDRRTPFWATHTALGMLIIAQGAFDLWLVER